MKSFALATIFVASVAVVAASPYYGPALQAYPNGAVVPVEPADVQAEKAKHFAEHAARGGYAGYGHGPVIGPGGVPVDTPEVQAAKAAHFAAVAKAKVGAYSAPVHAYAPGPVHHYAYAPAPVIVNGVPVETPEVQHAKAAHFAAVAKAAGGVYAHGPAYYGEDDGSYKPSHYADGVY